MNRRSFAFAAAVLAACAAAPALAATPTYSRAEISRMGGPVLGVSAETMNAVLDRVFADNGGAPTGFITGEEASGAAGIGLRYGKGVLHMKGRKPVQVYWQGPSVGWDVGGNASKVVTLVYAMPAPDLIFRRFPGVEGSAYLVAGLGVNYQRAEGITLAPIRAGVGLRAGANVGYLAYSRKRHILPF